MTIAPATATTAAPRTTTEVRAARPAPAEILLRTQTDERLVALAGRGSERAFVELVGRHRASLYATALRLVPAAQAEDAVQQALLQAWLALRSAAQVRHPKAWLHQILRHCALRLLARTVATDELEAAAVATRPATEEAYASFQTRAALRETLAEVARLPDSQRVALLETAVAGRSQRDVATELGTSEGGVRQLVLRARRSLRAAATALVPWPLALRLAQVAGEPPGTNAATTGGMAAGAAVAAKATVALLSVGAVAGVGGVAIGNHPRLPSPAATRVPVKRSAAATGTSQRVLSAASGAGQGHGGALGGHDADQHAEPARGRRGHGTSRSSERGSRDGGHRSAGSGPEPADDLMGGGVSGSTSDGDGGDRTGSSGEDSGGADPGSGDTGREGVAPATVTTLAASGPREGGSDDSSSSSSGVSTTGSDDRSSSDLADDGLSGSEG